MEFSGTSRFRLVRLLGTGGMGNVYEVYDKQSSRNIALKMMQQMNGAALYRLKREFRILSDIKHKNLIEFYELISEEGLWFYTMELVSGINFINYTTSADILDKEDNIANIINPGISDEKLKDAAFTDDKINTQLPSKLNRSYNPEKLRKAMIQLCHGINFLHSNGIVHRDIKPSNVLVTNHGRVVILDFGLVKELSQDARSSTPIGFRGTPAYMAPEQVIQDESDIDKSTTASDWYAVGVMLYQALCGILPFTGSLYQVIYAKQIGKFVPPSEINSAVEPEWNKLCLDLIKIKPEDRLTGLEVLKRLGAKPDEKLPKIFLSSDIISTAREIFIGRQEEMEQLQQYWKETLTGEPRLIFVNGPSGIGKTTLINHFIAELGELNNEGSNLKQIWLRGRFYERETIPYKAFDTIIDDLTHHLSFLDNEELGFVLPDDIYYLVGIFPVLKRVNMVNDPRYMKTDIRDPHELQKRAFSAFRTLLKKLVKIRRIIIFIDDIQWADNVSLELLLTLTNPPNPPPIFYLTCFLQDSTSNDTNINRQLRTLAALDGANYLELFPLSHNDSVNLIKKLMNLNGININVKGTTLLLENIAREGSGNPFFVSELVRYLTNLNDSTFSNERESIKLENVIQNRIEALPAGCRKLLELIAINRDPLPQSILAQAAGISLTSSEWNRNIAALRAGGLIRRRGMRSTDLVELYHNRIGDLVLENIDETNLQQHHIKLATTMESWGKASFDQLARHWMGAGQKKRARFYIHKAAHSASSKFAFERAANLYRMVLALEDDEAVKVELWKARGEALENAGKPIEAAKAYKNAMLGADAATRLEAMNSSAKQLILSGQITKGFETLQKVFDEIDLKIHSTPRKALPSLYLKRYLLTLRGLSFKKIDSSKISRWELTKLDILFSISFKFFLIVPIKGAEIQEIFIRQALKKGETERVSAAMLLEAMYSTIVRRKFLGKSLSLIRDGEILARKSNNSKLLGIAFFAKGMIDYYAGSWQAASYHFNQAEEQLQNNCPGATFELSAIRLFRCSSILQKGDLKELQELNDKYFRESIKVGDVFTKVNMITRMNILKLAQDSPKQASKDYQEVFNAWPDDEFHLQHYYYLFANLQKLIYEENAKEAYSVSEKSIHKFNNSFIAKLLMIRIEAKYLRGRVLLSYLQTLKESSRKRSLIDETLRNSKALINEKIAYSVAWGTILKCAANWIRYKNKDRTIHQLNDVISRLEATDCKLYAYSAKRVKAKFLKGKEGEQLMSEAENWMKNQNIKNFDKMTNLIIPGFLDI